MRAYGIQEAIANMTGVIILLLQAAAVVILASLIILIIYAVIKSMIQGIAKEFKGGKKDE